MPAGTRSSSSTIPQTAAEAFRRDRARLADAAQPVARRILARPRRRAGRRPQRRRRPLQERRPPTRPRSTASSRCRASASSSCRSRPPPRIDAAAKERFDEQRAGPGHQQARRAQPRRPQQHLLPSARRHADRPGRGRAPLRDRRGGRRTPVRPPARQDGVLPEPAGRTPPPSRPPRSRPRPRPARSRSRWSTPSPGRRAPSIRPRSAAPARAACSSSCRRRPRRWRRPSASPTRRTVSPPTPPTMPSSAPPSSASSTRAIGGSFIMTFAAYNAGPSRVTAWVKQYGDPRDPNVDVGQLDRAHPLHRDAQLRPAHHGEHAGLPGPARRAGADHRVRPEARRVTGLDFRPRRAFASFCGDGRSPPLIGRMATRTTSRPPRSRSRRERPGTGRRDLHYTSGDGLRLHVAEYGDRDLAVAAGRLPARPVAERPRFPRPRGPSLAPTATGRAACSPSTFAAAAGPSGTRTSRTTPRSSRCRTSSTAWPRSASAARSWSARRAAASSRC